VELERGRIARYRILAPTEWNFHPQGVVAESLGALQGNSNEIEQQARMLVDAIDPCVGYDLEVI
jgi:coenzyme F420-reducing hydrogenase alpha subunit